MPENACKCGNTKVCGMEVRGVYDGVLYWFCFNCCAAWQRWDKSNRLHKVAQPYIDADNQCAAQTTEA